MSRAVTAVCLADVHAAQVRLAGIAERTSVMRCVAGAPAEVFLKLENLQPIGSFKIRPVGNAVLARDPADLGAGLYTCSSGNSAVALAWLAQRLNLPATAVVTDAAPQAKLLRLRALGARIREVPFAAWWHAVEVCGLADEAGTYIDAVRDPAALAGDATLGIEILEQLPGVEAIFTPFGGGALACGIACAVRALNPRVKVIACELETAQPFAASLRAGHVVRTESRPGFVSGVGFHTLLPEMWPLCREVIDGALTVTLAEVAAAIRLMAEDNKVIAEGAGAVPVAAALSGRHPYRRVCAVVSGGNLGNEALTTILAGGMP
jgi:threonine dehydratase